MNNVATNINDQKIQAVIIPNNYSIQETHKILKNLNVKATKKVHKTTKYRRYRIIEPNSNYKYTSEIRNDGVEIIRYST
jgi:hypothetical protein